jgi:hypothetical protein
VTAAYRPSGEGIDLRVAGRRLSDLGFLAGPDLPDRPGPAYLLVALRDQPTLHHYDPERIEYWVTHEGRGMRESLTRCRRLPVDVAFSWGIIRLFDRLVVTNEYLTFGGHLSAAEVDGVTIATLTSPVPLLRRGGHSQIWDEGTDELAAFFARVLAALDRDPALESRLASADPFVRYAAFLGEVVSRYRSSADLRALSPRSWTLLLSEASLMRHEHPDAWHRGETILAEMWCADPTGRPGARATPWRPRADDASI